MLFVEQRETVMANAEPIDNRLFVLILQHPQEKKEPLATAALTSALLRRVELAVGLSWPNLSRALGHPADPQRWAVLYLGSARPAALGRQQEVIALDRRGAPLPLGAREQVDQDRRGTGHVERLHLPAAGNPHHLVADGECRRVEAGFLIAEEQGDRATSGSLLRYRALGKRGADEPVC